MLLDAYLRSRNETNAAFASRCEVSPRTIARVRSGDACRLILAARIVEESFSHPAPGGGVVSFDDLVAGMKASGS